MMSVEKMKVTCW